MATRQSAIERALSASANSFGVVEYSEGGGDVPAAVLRDCLLRIRPRRLWLKKMRVVGALDLEAAQIGYPVKFEDCDFEQTPNLEQATVAGLHLVDCRLPGLHCDQITVATNVVLRDCTSTGQVRFSGARIKGQWRLLGTRLDTPGAIALRADGAQVAQDMQCTNGFEVEGTVSMIGARIGGQFECDDATFRNPGGRALVLSGLNVDEHMFWRRGFSVDGEVILRGAKVNGKFDCSGGAFRNPSGLALSGEGLDVATDLSFADGCTVDGEVNLTGCVVRGQLILSGGRFTNPGRKVLDLARARVSQNVICRSGFVAEGKVLLAGATIEGNLWCEGGRFANGTDTALDAVGLTVQRDLLLSQTSAEFGTGHEGCYAEGRVVLSDSTVGGNFDCTGGQFRNPGRESLVATGISVTRDAVFRTGFVADGLVDLVGAKVGGRLDCVGGHFANSSDALRGDRIEVKQSAQFDDAHVRGRITLCSAKIAGELSFTRAELAGNGWALVLKGACVGGPLRLKFATKPVGGIDLYQVKAAHLDDRESEWPDRVRLNEFVYEALPEDGADVATRIDWLRRNHRYTPQVYLRLAKVYETAGRHDYAKRVLIAGEDARRKARTGVNGRLVRVFDWLLKFTVGYGYRPLWVLYWLAGLLLVGWRVFSAIGTAGFLEPKASGAQFAPFLYTLDLLLPVASLRQREVWVPDGAALWWSSAFTVLGWVLAICLVTGLGKAFKREL